jgi:hypothetical protein
MTTAGHVGRDQRDQAGADQPTDPIAFRGLVEGRMNATAQCWHLPVSVAFALVRRWLVLCLT